MDEIEKLKKEVSELRDKIEHYEGDGPAKLYYSLNRKSSEMADMLNEYKMREIPIDDPKNKIFERLMSIVKTSTDTAGAVKSLAEVAGITGDEQKDIKRRPVTPESMADVLGNTAGKRN